MAEYIERDKLLKFKADVYDEDGHVLYAVPTGYIVTMPHDDVAPVVHGKWEIVVGSNGKEYMVCTCCRVSQDLTGVFTYCPNCGAKMYGGED